MMMVVKIQQLLPLLLLLLAAAASSSAGGKIDYGDALDKSLLFFEAQRSGYLPWNQRVKWRRNSALKDGYAEKVDLVGGYYDAGDNLKFGLPMAYSVTLMSWAAVDFRKEILDANQMEATLEAIKWGTDYFIKAHTQPNELWVQVGEGEPDHSCWERPEDMTTPRTAYKIDSGNPGSDVAGETAAALAAASLAFKPYNSSYSNVLLSHAKTIFSFADNYRGEYDYTVTDAKSFYPTSGYSDELLWAAGWLYKATNNDYFLQYTTYKAVELGGTGNAVRIFSWDNKYAGLQILLTKILFDGSSSYATTLQQYKAKADFYTCAYLQKNADYNVPSTPGGLSYTLASNNMQYSASAAFLLAIYSTYLKSSNVKVVCPDDPEVSANEVLTFAKKQADYILGQNPMGMSYLVGFSEKYPQQVHHRGASIPSVYALPEKVGCVEGMDKWYKNPNGNPNVLVGALVGGPDSSDEFCDERSNYEQNEPTTSTNAPLIGLFAKLNSVYSTTSSPSDSGGGYDDNNSSKGKSNNDESEKKKNSSPSMFEQVSAPPPSKQQTPADASIPPTPTEATSSNKTLLAPTPAPTTDYYMEAVKSNAHLLVLPPSYITFITSAAAIILTTLL